MANAESNDIADVLNLVRTWAPDMRIAFARKVLETIETPTISNPAQAMAFDEVVGLLKTNEPPPDDQQCAKFIEEERLRKHG